MKDIGIDRLVAGTLAARITCAACDLPIDTDQAWHDVEGLGTVHTSQQGCADAHHRAEEGTRPTPSQEAPA